MGDGDERPPLGTEYDSFDLLMVAAILLLFFSQMMTAQYPTELDR